MARTNPSAPAIVVGSLLTSLLLIVAVAVVATTSLVVPTSHAGTSKQDRGEDFTEPPRFSWPLEGRPAVVKTFDPPDGAYGAGHRGVDLAATEGDDVLAAAEGFVVFAGRVAGRGVVSIDHDGGLRTTYEPVAWSVSKGDRVFRGEVIGTVVAGHRGCPARACLHWGVRRGSDYLDPLPLVIPNGVLALKPWTVMPMPP
ncbi:M23 family metallopeptidase [Saccharomonospora xinjiangensis]|uniref:Metalloendopeptidase-like membrane protein n=1 Tax=Saccharomonospora xinjiangensis XJ-54 TaxID=882086 RepID=I0UZE4_9PSEU|nr:M23 family metallopeptidase [Saccharomonospora xinjiangensis]EID53247.1 metalloendopeptidase-like membrane protein [Saccharomonospora xinjiangensis XJ-54]